MASDDFTLAPPPGPRCIDCGKPLVWSRGPGRRPKRCPEHARERERHRERQRTPEYRQRERERQRTPEYRERQRERRREHRRTPEYRRRERNAKAGRYRNLLVRLIVRQGALCALCGNRLPEDAADIHVDHVVPVARGGTSDPENLQAVCAVCNLRKGAGGNPPPRDFLTAPAEESNYRAPDE